MTKNEPFQIHITKLVQTSVPLLQDLKIVYDQLPITLCRRQVRCCSLLPEMTLLEALQALKAMMSWPPAERTQVIKKIVRYFFSNAVGISSCPFLNGKECLIYPDRFFGCRAYGLWSKEYYQDLAGKNRQGKLVLQNQWQKLGITLPEEVVSFEVPYCSQVETEPPTVINDEMLLSASDRIEILSGDVNPWDREFRENYFSDLSFFITGRQFGPQESVRLKYFITRDMIQKGDRSRLDQALLRVTDPLLE
jgi:Fe-S-cluster containining protein